jgi:hypothetical protein
MDALVRKGREYEREMDVRAAVQCYEVSHHSSSSKLLWSHEIQTAPTLSPLHRCPLDAMLFLQRWSTQGPST